MLHQPVFKAAAIERHGIPAPPRNRLLAMLPDVEYRRVTAALEETPLVLRKLLPAGHVYFLSEGIVSVTAGDGGEDVEIALVGSEGMVGAAAAMGALDWPWRATVRAGGRAWRLPSGRLPALMDMNKAFAAILQRYLAITLLESGQHIVCASRHSIAQRIARWLLTGQDRLGSEVVSCTHEYLSRALGVRRAGVTMGLGQMERAGIIEQRRGSVQVRDRQKLVAQSCGCDRLTRLHYERLLA